MRKRIEMGRGYIVGGVGGKLGKCMEERKREG
jgi:hypothetical protein